MKLLQTLFNKWSKAPSQETIIKLLDKQPQQVLAAIANGSNNEKSMDVRVAAVMRLSYGSDLLNASTNKNKTLSKSARLRLVYFIDNKTIDPIQLIAEVKDKETLLAIAGQCEDQLLQSTVLDSINDQHQLADICSQSHSATMRKTLVKRIDKPELLRGLLKKLKAKDKNSYKIIKQKLNQLKVKEDAATELKKTVQQLCDQIQQHTSRHFDKNYVSRFERLVMRWSDIESSPIDYPLIEARQQEDFNANRSLCQQRIDERKQQADTEQKFLENLSSADRNRQLLLESFWLYINKLYDLDKVDELALDKLEEENKQLQSTWNELQEYGTSQEVHNQQYQSLCQIAGDTLKAYKDKGLLKTCYERIRQAEDPTQIAKVDLNYFRMLVEPIVNLSGFAIKKPLSDYCIVLKELRKKFSELADFEKKQLHLILNLIRKSHTALHKGHLKKALGIRHSIDEKTASLSSLPQRHAHQLNLLTEDLEKMVDWQAYVVVPKKHQLIEAMQKLVSAPMPIEVLAIQIKKLQAEWRLLKQNGDDRQEDLWHKFSQLADEAYLPCKEHYGKLADQRKKNLEKRQQLVQQLQEFYRSNDWENAQWGSVEKILATAKKEIYSYSPVESMPNKTVMESFDIIKQSIQDKIDSKYKIYKQEKLQLIVQAEKLTNVKDIEQAISSVKRLQSQWKYVPRGFYKEDDQLWKQFRHWCDLIFDKKQILADEHNQHLKKNAEKAKKLMGEAEQYLALTGDVFLSKRKEFSDCKVAFHKIGELPRDVANKIQREFSHKCEKFEKKIARELIQLTEISWQVFFSLIEKINACQRALSLKNADFCEMINNTNHEILQVMHWPEGAKKVIANKVKNMMPQKKEDELENRNSLQLLCIRMDLLTNTDSPEAEKKRRFEYQVEQLQKGASGMPLMIDESKKLALEWAAIGATDPKEYDYYYKRFHDCWKNAFN